MHQCVCAPQGSQEGAVETADEAYEGGSDALVNQGAGEGPVGYAVKRFTEVYVKAVRCRAALVICQNLGNVIRAPAVGRATVLRLVNRPIRRGALLEFPCRMSGHYLI